MVALAPGVARLWHGLGRSPFLGDVDPNRREPGRILGAVLGGILVGFTAGAAGEVLLSALYTLATGRGGEGMAGLEQTLILAERGSPSGVAPSLPGLAITIGADCLFVIGFVAFAALLARRPFHAYVTVARKVRWRLFAVGAVLSLLAVAPLAAVDRWLGGAGGAMPNLAPGWPVWLAYGVGALLLLPAAAVEELLFRGWLLRQIAVLTRRPSVLIAATALAFTLAHFDFSPDGFLLRFVMGLGFAYMTLRTGGVELACAAHGANNALVFVLFAPASATAGADPGLTPEALVFDGALLAGYVAVAEAIARIDALRDWAGVRPQETSPEA